MSHNQRKTNNEFVKINMSDHSQKKLALAVKNSNATICYN